MSFYGATDIYNASGISADGAPSTILIRIINFKRTAVVLVLPEIILRRYYSLNIRISLKNIEQVQSEVYVEPFSFPDEIVSASRYGCV